MIRAMPVQKTEYLDWAIGRYESLRINLASSGVPSAPSSGFANPPAPDDAHAWIRLAEFVVERAGWGRGEATATAGATGAMTLACAVLLGPGDRALVERPTYEPLVRIPAGFGAAVDRFDRRPGNGWALDPDTIAAAMRPGTRIVLVTEPNNPTGVLSPPEAIAAAAEVVEGAGAKLFVNEVYRRFHPVRSARSLDAGIIVGESVTKFEGVWWARGGWLGGPADFVERARAAQVTLSVLPPGGAAWALAALQRPDLADRARALAAPGKRALVAEWVRRHPRLSWTEPRGGLFGFVHVADAPNLRALAERLQKERGVLFAPGSFFEMAEWMRISWTDSPERIAEGLEIVGSALGL